MSQTLITHLERSLPIVASAFGRKFDVDIRIGGTEARTDGNRIYLPAIKTDNCTNDILFGYLAHESGHVRMTDFSVIRQLSSSLHKSIWNVFEDIFIETGMISIYPGTRITLSATASFVAKQLNPITSDDDMGNMLFKHLLYRLRYEQLNQDGFGDLYSRSIDLKDHFPPKFLSELEDILLDVPNISCSQESVDLTNRVLGSLKDSLDIAVPEEKAESDDSSESDAEATSAESDDSSESDAEATSAESDDSSESDDDAGSAYDKLLEETDVPFDVLKEAIGALSDEFNESSEIQREFDPYEVELRANSLGEQELNKTPSESIREAILFSSSLRSKLVGLLASHHRDQQYLASTAKRVSGRHISRMASGNTKVFIRKDEKPAINTAVHILVDRSGSMAGEQTTANQATLALAMALHSIKGTDVAVSAFPAESRFKFVAPIVNRGQPIRNNMGRFDIQSTGGTPLADAMMFASRELMQSDKEKKVLLIITDGAPDSEDSVLYMNSLIKGYIDTYAIGIGTTAVYKYFEKSTVIDKVSELRNALFTIARQIYDLK